MKTKISITIDTAILAGVDAIAAQEGAERAAAAKGPNRSGIIETILGRELAELAAEGDTWIMAEAAREHFPRAKVADLEKIYGRLKKITGEIPRETKIVKGYFKRYGQRET
jgi:hypothetical protein